MEFGERFSLNQPNPNNGNENGNGNDTAVADNDAVAPSRPKKTFKLTIQMVIFFIGMFIISMVITGLVVYHTAVCSKAITQLNGRPGSDVISLDSHGNHLPALEHAEHELNFTRETLDLRLPRSIKPILYDIKLIPYLFGNNFTFAGEVRILLNVTEQCQNITLHAISLAIANSDVRVRRMHGDSLGSPVSEPIPIKTQYFLESKQFYVIELNETLANGSFYVLEIKYIGILNDMMQGFYRSSYPYGNETRWEFNLFWFYWYIWQQKSMRFDSIYFIRCWMLTDG